MRRMYQERLPRPVFSRSEYPLDLRDLLELSQERGIEVEVKKVHCLCDGWHEEYYWQTTASQELIDLSVLRWELSPLDKDSTEVRLFWERMPASWDVSPPDEADYYISSHFSFDFRVLIMHDRPGQCLYYWYEFDF
jgi:hypothetical protein